MEFLQSLDPLLRTFWYIAGPVSLIFLVQTVMTFMGTDASDGLHADFDGNLDGGDSTFQLFSFRNLINFLLGFSWAGITFYSIIDSKFWLIAVAFAIGILMVGLFFVTIKQIMKLGEDNSFKIEEALNKTAEVYLRVPAERSGKGKVQLSIRGAVHELDALSDGPEIPTGTMVRIVKVEDRKIVIIEK
ncbi:MAG TPA: serine protease [Bacteroidia bacterium]